MRPPRHLRPLRNCRRQAAPPGFRFDRVMVALALSFFSSALVLGYPRRADWLFVTFALVK